ncbi:glycosyltransferase [Luteimonas sp. MJ246]|uniref:glycosyltransferase n=1 Tax=Luteimonas sp. MJ174 TaxID=3129237 RepID=UPI0031BA193B
MKIVIVTYNWPPRNAIGTHRPYSWAKAWAKNGAQVMVITAQKQAFDEPLDLELPAIPGVQVVEVPYMRGAGHAASLLGAGRIKAAAKKYWTILRKLSGRTLQARDRWAVDAEEFARLASSDADIVVSTYGPAAAHVIASKMKAANPAIKWVADYRDPWSNNREFSLAQQSSERALERNTIESADFVTTVSPSLVVELERFLGKRVELVPNGFDLDEDAVIEALSRDTRRPVNSPMRIVYTGMLYAGTRDPQPLLTALAELSDAGHIKHGDITVDFYGARVELAAKLASNGRYGPFVRIFGHVTRDVALRAQRSADLLLLLEGSGEESRGVLTGKIFEYICSGRPILCIGSRPDFDIGLVIKECGVGTLVYENYDKTLPALILATMRGEGVCSAYQPIVKEVLKYSRQRSAKRMFHLMTTS